MLGEVTDADNIMHPQHFGTDPTEILIRINPKIPIWIPDHFWLKFWRWWGFALSDCSCCGYVAVDNWSGRSSGVNHEAYVTRSQYVQHACRCQRSFHLHWSVLHYNDLLTHDDRLLPINSQILVGFWLIFCENCHWACRYMWKVRLCAKGENRRYLILRWWCGIVVMRWTQST